MRGDSSGGERGARCSLALLQILPGHPALLSAGRSDTATSNCSDFSFPTTDSITVVHERSTWFRRTYPTGQICTLYTYATTLPYLARLYLLHTAHHLHTPPFQHCLVSCALSACLRFGCEATHRHAPLFACGLGLPALLLRNHADH